MSVRPWCIVQDGHWTGELLHCTEDDLQLALRPGCLALSGEAPALIGAGAMLPPVAPGATPWVTWHWDAEALQHVGVPTAAAIARDMRAKRDRLLAACDWTQLPDVPAHTSALWAAYRQALRDITDQPGWPTDITWPTPPTGA